MTGYIWDACANGGRGRYSSITLGDVDSIGNVLGGGTQNVITGENATSKEYRDPLTGAPETDQMPGFGDSFTVSQVVTDSTGGVSELNARQVKIPNNTASKTAAGLMGAADKVKLDALPDCAAAADLDAILAGGAHFGFYTTTSATLGTPYKQGITGFTAYLVLSYANSADYGMQMAFCAGTDTVFVRKRNAGTNQAWRAIAPA